MNKGVPPLEIFNKKKIGNGAIRVILELICAFFFVVIYLFIFLESGATPVYPEQLAGMIL